MYENTGIHETVDMNASRKKLRKNCSEKNTKAVTGAVPFQKHITSLLVPYY